MANDERGELRDLTSRSRKFLSETRDPTHRRTISDLLAFLESKLAEAVKAADPT
jgi:hypothetical protein